MPDAALEAQAAKRAADDRRAVKEAKHLLLRYRGLMAEHEVEVPGELDRAAFAWLQQQSIPGEP